MCLDVFSCLQFIFFWGELMRFFCIEYLQDSLVVCRLRKNCDFRLNNTPNQASGSRRMPHNNCTMSEGGTDVTGMSEGDKAVESCSKKCSSSHDSYSIEQTDSANEAEQKLLDDVNLTASSSHQKVGFFLLLFHILYYLLDRQSLSMCYHIFMQVYPVTFPSFAGFKPRCSF